jgi:hypothetical protein
MTDTLRPQAPHTLADARTLSLLRFGDDQRTAAVAYVLHVTRSCLSCFTAYARLVNTDAPGDQPPHTLADAERLLVDADGFMLHMAHCQSCGDEFGRRCEEREAGVIEEEELAGTMGADRLLNRQLAEHPHRAFTRYLAKQQKSS